MTDDLRAGAGVLERAHDAGADAPAAPRKRRMSAMREKIGDLTMENELLEAKIDRMEGGVPFSRRRSRR